MKVGFVVGKLGFGGAESQLIRLSKGLVARGHSVSIMCYAGSSSRDIELKDTDVELRVYDSAGRLARIKDFRSWVSDFQPEVVHGVMKRASTLAVLGRKQRSQFKIVGNDLSTATYNRWNVSLWIALAAFVRADVVVTQTSLNENSMTKLAPWLKGKTKVIRNGIDTYSFLPKRIESQEPSPFRFGVVGTVYSIKNPLAVVKAVAMLRDRQPREFAVDWYGRRGLKGDNTPSSDYHASVQLAQQMGIQGILKFHGELNPIHAAYHSSDCLLHPSIQEGFPNAVVEGMACGLPILVGQISDLPRVVAEANNGIVFNQKNPTEIADAMERMLNLSPVEVTEMGRRSRDLAVRWFGMDRFIQEYESLYESLLK